MRRPSGLNPVTGATTVRRGRVPDEASYAHGGVFAQTVLRGRARSRAPPSGAFASSTASYRASAADSPLVDGAPLWPDDSAAQHQPGFRAGVSCSRTTAGRRLQPESRVSRAAHHRSRHARSDRLRFRGRRARRGGARGDGGHDGLAHGGLDGRSRRTGRRRRPASPPTSSSRYRARSFHAEFSYFNNTIHDNIQKQALILPQGRSASCSAGSRRRAAVQRRCLRAGLLEPRARAGQFRRRPRAGRGGHCRVEAAARAHGRRPVYLPARAGSGDRRAAEHRGGHAGAGRLRDRALHRAERALVGRAYLHGAARQSRLSTLDLEDRRTGATRSRTSIRNFFLNGATVRGWVTPGPDAVPGTADDVLTVTGETVAQIQDRVLGAASRLRRSSRQSRPTSRWASGPGARGTARGPGGRREPRRRELPRHQLGSGCTGPWHHSQVHAAHAIAFGADAECGIRCHSSCVRRFHPPHSGLFRTPSSELQVIPFRIPHSELL